MTEGGSGLVDLREVSRTYHHGPVDVPALRAVDLRIDEGEFVAVVGPSGSGKSTLMNIIGCLDRQSTGTYRLRGVDVAGLGDDGLAQVRSRTIGFVFQAYNLIPRTSAVLNVATPLLYQGVPRRERLRRAAVVLELLGLGDRLQHDPSELSGGQQQRVAIGRALVTDPPLLLADEPTGNLDSESGAEVLALLQDVHRAGRTILMITHDRRVGAAATRRVGVLDGRIVGDEREASWE